MNAIALGTDLVEVARIRRAIDKHGDRLLERCFTDTERTESERSGPERAAERYAARFAAKEAASKAIGTGIAGGVTWRDFEVLSDTLGKPALRVHGVASDRARSLGIRSWLCSMSHTGEHATATVIGLG
ncbi:MAG: holo-ACP synthase [Planctomycetota bacterium]